MNKSVTSWFFILTLVLLIICQSCTSTIENELEIIFEQMNENIDRSLERRVSQNNLKIALLLDELRNSELDETRIKEIKDEIDRLDTEKLFIFRLKPQELHIKFNVIEETEVNPNQSIIKIKIQGKTLQSQPGKESKLINIPEDACYLMFKFDKTKKKNKITGPFKFTPENH